MTLDDTTELRPPNPSTRRGDRDLSWERSKRMLLVAIFAALVGLCVFFIGGWAERGRTIDNLTTTQARNRPTALFNEASFAAQACRRDYDERFFADVADLSLVDRSDLNAVSAARAAVLRDRQDLANIRALCPSPTPPQFDSAGNLTDGPVIKPLTTIPPLTAAPPETTTTTAEPPPESSAAAPAPTLRAPTTTIAAPPTTTCETLPNDKCRKA